MRSILALGILVLGMHGAAREPEYPAFFADHLHSKGTYSATALVEIDSALGRGDRLAVLRPGAVGNSDESHEVDAADSLLAQPLPATFAEFYEAPPSLQSEPASAPDIPMGDLCQALLTSAQENDLPVAFFANLIWQESRLRDDAVSPVGALGIAQFMPQVAMASGLNDPFDPLQAIPASAHLLRELREQFGNLGFVAAAYNAGARRVSEWLERRRSLPRETLGYVVQVTGRSVEQWRTTPPGDAALTFVRHLPCRDLPAFAELEQTQLEQAQMRRAQSEAEHHAGPTAAPPQAPHGHAASSAAHDRAAHHIVAERKRAHDEPRAAAIHVSEHHHGGGKRQAEHLPRASHDKRKSVSA